MQIDIPSFHYFNVLDSQKNRIDFEKRGNLKSSQNVYFDAFSKLLRKEPRK